METNRNPVGLIIGALICIFIGIASCQIAYKTFKQINTSDEDKYIYNNKFFSEEQVKEGANLSDKSLKNYLSHFGIEKNKNFSEIENQGKYAILYASSFIFSISLCCFSYICVKSSSQT